MPFLAVFSFIFRNWRAFAIGAAVLAVVGGLFWYRGEIRTAVYNEVYRTEVEGVLKTKDDQLAALRDQVQSQALTLERYRKASVAVAERQSDAQARVQAHIAEDRPVGPLLEEALR